MQTQPTTRRTLLQNAQLLPQDWDFGFQSLLRLKEVAQHAQEHEPDCDHSAIMF
jgi:hypothetical protein